MNLRFYTVYLALLTFTEVAAAAENAAWNCEQGANGEWTCLNEGQTGQATAQPKVISPKPATAVVQQAKPDDVPQVPEVKSAPVITQAPTAPTITQEPVVQQVEVAQPSTEKLTAQVVPETQKLHVRFSENEKPVLETAPSRAEPSTRVAKNPGWSCQSGDESANWNCNLVGPDPKGEAKIAEESQSNSYWFTPTYNNQQERTFQALRSEFEQDPWQNCSSWSAKKTKHTTTSKGARETANTDVTADFSEVFDGEILNFAGNVDLNRADQHLLANKASYDTVADTMDAQGDVIYSEDTLAFSGNTASMSLGKDEARLRQSQFILAEAPFRGTADVVYRDNKSLSRYQEATFTSCPPGNQDWVAHASRIKINRETGLGSAKNAWLEFKGVPFIYTPYISFPTDNRRTSGLLAPAWANTQRNGFDISTPIYWSIAPNFDTTITPRYLEKRGAMLRNNFRYLTESSKGNLATEFMPYDQLKDRSRYLASFKDNTQFSPSLSMATNLNYVSDKLYFNDMNNALGIQTNRFLSSIANVNYGGLPYTDFSVGAYHYQSIDPTITPNGMPYDMLPRVNLNLNRTLDSMPYSMPLALSMQNQYTNFYRVNPNASLANGQRFNTAPSISMPLETSAGFVIPKITGQYTQYQLTNQSEPGLPSTISRFLPIISVDSGMTFEKEIHIGDSPYTHTLEPRAFYLYIPRKDQSNIPIFDTSTYDTNYYSLFRENHFSGMDRIQDANQITLGGSSRFIDSTTGLEPLKISLGQIVYFQDRSVSLYDKNNPASAYVSPQTATTSNFVGELAGQINKNLSYTLGGQWDPVANSVSRGVTQLRYRNQPDQIFDIGYRYRSANSASNQSGAITTPYTISQTDASFRWPLAAGWYGLGRWQYSFTFNTTTESFIGLEKENCCWRFRVIGRRYINGANSANGTLNLADPTSARPENAIFVQLELKGLTNFGNSVDQFLQNNLPGFRPAKYFED